MKPGLDTDKTKTAQIYAQSRATGFGPEVQKRILLGTYALSAESVHFLRSITSTANFLFLQRLRQLLSAGSKDSTSD